MSDKLGSGSFGDVYSGFNTEDPEKKIGCKNIEYGVFG